MDTTDWIFSPDICTRREFLSTITTTLGLLSIIPDSESDSGASPEDIAQLRASSTPPPYPEDPFMQPSYGIPFLLDKEDTWNGFMETSQGQKLKSILNLHPDVLAYDNLSQFEEGEVRTWQAQSDQLAIAQELGRPATSGWNVNIKINEEVAESRYGPLIDRWGWEYPDGTSLESPRDILATTFHGEPQRIFGNMGTPSVFGPGGLDLLVHTTEVRLNQGYSGFHVDGVGVFHFNGLDFSRWAKAAFRSHLQSVSEQRLTELGVVNPETFDIKKYLQRNELTPNEDTDPLTDQVFREYLLHHHEGINKWFADYRTAIEDRFPDRMSSNEIGLYANQFTGHFNNPQSANVYISDSMNVIFTELFPRVKPAVDVNYKTMRSVGNFSKPVIAKGTLTAISDEKLGAINPRTENPNLLRFQAAEAYACGARLFLPLTARTGYSESEMVTNWVKPDGTVPPELRSFADFVWTHQRFLTGLSPGSDLALIWSLPTRIWRHEPTWDIGQESTPRLDSFLGAAKLLREAGFAYDVLTFGHPRLWDDSEQLDRLNDYDVIVLPAVESITDEQLEVLASYLDEDGSIINSGPIPDRNDFYEPRDDVASILDHENVTILNDDPARKREAEGIRDSSLATAIKAHGVHPARTNNDISIAVQAHTQSDPSRGILQLLNYDYDTSSDSFSTKSQFEVRLPEYGMENPIVRYYSPQHQQELDVTRNGEIIYVDIPELIEWGIVVVAEGSERFIEGDQKAAQSKINKADENVQAAIDAGNDETDAFVMAETQLSAAETALDFDAYEQALEAAEEAIAVLSADDPELPPIGTNDSQPTDPDADGRYEDIDGNGEFSIVDVQSLFIERDSDAVQNHSNQFDFNDDGKFSIADIQTLFKSLNK